MKLQQDFYNKTQLAMADTQASEKEMVSSFATLQCQQIVATPTSDPTVPLILGIGLLLAILVSRGLIPSVADWKYKAAFQRSAPKCFVPTDQRRSRRNHSGAVCDGDAAIAGCRSAFFEPTS